MKKKKKKHSFYRGIRRLRKKMRLARPGYFYDFNLLAAVIILLSFGLVMLYSASAYDAMRTFKTDTYYFMRQSIISVVSIIWVLLVSLIDYHVYMKLSGYMYIIALILMALVRFSPLGVEAYGSRRWLKLGVQFQPSEVAKIAVILFIPYIMLKMGKKVKTVKGEIVVLTFGVIQAIGAWQLTDNLSTGIIIGMISCVIVYLADPKSARLLILALVLIAVAGVILLWLKNHLDILQSGDGFRMVRIYDWLNGGSYQVLQGLYAIGSGGFMGKGLGNSTQKLSAIPEAQNDFIFSVICEELGVFGALLLLLMFGYLLYRLFFIAQNAPDLYGVLIVSGIFGHIAIQVILNICVVMNLLPTTGITLPFVSYGGTSILFLMTEMGIALGVSRQIVLRDGMDLEKPEEESGKNVLTNA